MEPPAGNESSLGSESSGAFGIFSFSDFGCYDRCDDIALWF